jgi:hypothetical protein
MDDEPFPNTGAWGSSPANSSNPNWGRMDTSYGSGAPVGNTGAWGSPAPYIPPYTPSEPSSPSYSPIGLFVAASLLSPPSSSDATSSSGYSSGRYVGGRSSSSSESGGGAAGIVILLGFVACGLYACSHKETTPVPPPVPTSTYSSRIYTPPTHPSPTQSSSNRAYGTTSSAPRRLFAEQATRSAFQTAFVAASRLNVRPCPSPGCPSLGYLPRGVQVNILNDNASEWDQVSFRGISGKMTQGYVAKAYLRKTPAL